MNESILVVDDEREIADLLEICLANEGFAVRKAYSAAEALDIVAREELSLALLDVMLPDMDGFALCRAIREAHYFPIIMLTAKVDDTDKIMGLTMGADDYITKPFNPLEVVARVRTQLRRFTRYNPLSVGQGGAPEEYDVRGLVINRASHRCSLYGEDVALTPLEFAILWTLCANRGRVMSSERLFEEAWGERYLDNNNTVMSHIARLREKLREPPRQPRFIKTVWGVGYTIE